MANEFKVKNGLKFPDNTIQTTAATGGGSSVTVSLTAPGSPIAGDLWWSSGEGQLKIYYNDGTSSQWVDANSGAIGLTGYTGSQGTTGYTGSQGTTGSTGGLGYTGSQGTTGSTGYTGSASTVIGYTGSQGSIGYTGSQGNTGSTGYTGSKGNTGPIGPKTVGVVLPTTADKIVVMYTTTSTTISKLMAVLPAGTATPSVTYKVIYGSDVSGAGTLVVTAGSTTTSTSTGDSVTSFNNATISAGSFVWVTFDSVSGTVPMFSLTMEF